MAKRAQAQGKVNPKVELVARRGSELVARGEYSNALAHFEKVLSVDPKHVYALYGAAHCRASLMHHLRGHDRDAAIDSVLALCHRLILRTPESSLGDKREHLFPRETLRFAWDKIASYALERAKTKRDLEVALGHIERCLALTSPLDDKHALAPYLETKVRILLRIGRKEEASALQATTRRKEDRKSRRSLEERCGGSCAASCSWVRAARGRGTAARRFRASASLATRKASFATTSSRARARRCRSTRARTNAGRNNSRRSRRAAMHPRPPTPRPTRRKTRRATS